MYERLINKNINIDLKVVDRLFQSAVSQATDAIDIEGFKSGIENLKSIVTTTSHYRAEVQCIANIPNVGDSFTANQINKWLISDGNFGRPKSTRQGCDVIKARDLWVLKPEFMGDAMDRTLNRKTFRQMTRQITGWITAGYCRKSPSKETPQKRLELLQKMVNSLHVNDLCEKVFVSPICRASSDLLTRDISPTTTAQSILKQLRFQNGDMQDFLMFAKTMTSSIRLVVLDYAGLCTNPIDIRTFVKDVKTIEQIVIDHGHKLESFNRAELNNRKVISKFDCCKTSVKRSSL
ncbi:hypothetical protein G6F56_009933 [Rhizopus delemar]|nr:hypothetical protein G6F56_009933 [Rhizopus delemar]